MGHIDDLWRYDGRRAVVTGCASGIGEQVARQLVELGAEVVGLDRNPPALQLKEFHELDLADPASIERAVSAIGGPVDSLFNVAGVSSGVGNPLLVTTINFLGTRHLTEALAPIDAAGSSIAMRLVVGRVGYSSNGTTSRACSTRTSDEGIEWCGRNPDELADGGYRLSKEAIIFYCMLNAVPLGARSIRINCTGARGDRDADSRPTPHRVRSGVPRQLPEAVGARVRARRTGGCAGVPQQPGRKLHHGPGVVGGRRHMSPAALRLLLGGE